MSFRSRSWRRSLAAALSLALTLGLGSSGLVALAAGPGADSALATMGVHHLHGQPTKPRPTKNANLLSHGGAVETVPAIYISWWGPEWNTGFSTGGYTSTLAQTYLGDFFGGVGGTGWNQVVTQYCQGVPSGTQSCATVSGAVQITNPAGQLAGTWNDLTAVPASPSQSDIAAAARRLAANFGYNANATYLVFTPSGKSMSGFGTSWCAWHSSTSSNAGSLAYGYIPYQPDAGSACGRNFVNKTNNAYGNGWFDGFSVVAGHEYSEAETDPFPNSGWLDSRGEENADKCAWSGSSGNLSFGGHLYAVQPTWSNLTGACAMSA